MKFIPRIAVLMALALNAAAQAPAAPASPDTPPASSALDADLFYELLVGEMNTVGGQPGAGYSLMLDAARRTNDAALYQRAIEIALQARSGESALQAARAWRRAQPESRDANLYLLQVLIALNRIGETGEPLQSLLAATPRADRPALMAGLPRLYGRTQERPLATRLVEQALADELRDPVNGATAWTTVGRMRLHSKDAKGAREAAQRAQELNPSSEEPALLALELMEAGQADAQPIVNRYFGSAKPRPALRLAYAQVLVDLERHTEALRELRQLTAEAPEFAPGWLMLGLQQAQANDPQAQASLQRYLSLAESQPAGSEERQRGSTQAYLALAQLAEKRGDFAAAENWLSRIENAGELVSVQSRRASMLARQGRLKDGLRILQTLPERNAEEARAKLMAQVQLLRDNQQPRQAYDLLAQALTRNPRDPDLIYEQALLAEKIGRLDEMERLLRRLIALQPDHQHAYNALGYSLADRNVRLPEARELVKKALAIAPNDPFIQDSLGWVEFRQGNKAQALQILETAYQTRPDAEIAAHLGEVLWSLGQRDRATTVWREGLQRNPDNEALQHTMRRFGVRP